MASRCRMDVPAALLIVVRSGFFALLVILATLTARATEASAAAAGGTATGAVTIDGARLALKHAYVMAQPNTFDEQKTDVAVLLTEKPLPPDDLKGLEDLQDAGTGKHGWVFFKLDSEGRPIHEVIDHPKLGKTRLMMSGFTHAAFNPKVFGKNRVEGTFETKKTEDFMGHRYNIRVSFQAPVLQARRPEPLPDKNTGTALPPDGGEPGKAYLAYLKAIREKDIAAFRTFLSPDKANLSDEELKEGLEFLAQMTPADLTIGRGFVSGDRAVMYVTGTVEKETEYGTIELKKSGAGWRMHSEKWSNVAPKP